MFDSEVPTFKPAKSQPVWPLILGIILIITGYSAFMVFLIKSQQPEGNIIPTGPQQVHIVADDTRPSPTATVVSCSPGMEVGTICKFSFTPTPLPNCPPLTDKGLCVYTGVENFRERP